MKPKNPMVGALLAGVAILTAAAGVSQAATLVYDGAVSYNAPMTTPVDLTATGTVDWAFWESASASNVATLPMAPSNDSSSGTAISALSPVGGGANNNLRGSTGADSMGSYIWGNGSALGAGFTENPYNLAGGLVFNSSLNTAGSGFSLTVRGTPAQDYYVMLYFGGFAATGNLSLQLNGALSPPIVSTVFSGGAPKPMVGYQVHFRPDNANDLLTITYTASATSANGHVGIEAITVGLLPVLIPEPATLALCGLGGLLLIGRRRRP